MIPRGFLITKSALLLANPNCARFENFLWRPIKRSTTEIFGQTSNFKKVETVISPTAINGAFFKVKDLVTLTSGPRGFFNFLRTSLVMGLLAILWSDDK